MNNTVVIICLITITIALVILIGALIIQFLEVRRLCKAAEKLITHVERGVSPALIMLAKLSEDTARVTDTVRSRVERLDRTADHLTEDLASLVDTWTKTGYLLHDALVEPLVDMAALLKGLTRGVTFFIRDRKKDRTGAGGRGLQPRPGGKEAADEPA